MAAGMATQAEPRDRVPTAVVTVAGLAWAVSIGAQASGRTSLLGHEHLAESGLPAAAAIGLFVLSWQVMLAAMMLPSSLGMLRAFARLADAQPHPILVRGSFLAAYVGVWTVFGLAAFGGDVVLHRAVHASTWLRGHEWLIGGVVLIVAGAFQFSKLKDACLTECRTPVGFLVERYRPGGRSAFRLGVAHGAFCVGCCWALMVVAFAAGAGNLLWMAALTSIMVIERTVPWGASLARPVGVLLVLLGVIVVLHPAGFPAVLGAG